jgi:tetratricopeptide (TPR) repeat protein
MTKRILLAAVAVLTMSAGISRADEPGMKTPTPTDVLLNKGLELKKGKKYEDAGDFFRAVLKVNPKHTEAMYQLAWVCNELKDYEEAITWARAVTRMNPRDSDALRELGYGQYKTGDHAAAAKSLAAAIKLNPKDISAHEYMVMVHKALGDDDEANAWQIKLNQLKKPTKAADFSDLPKLVD